MKNTNEATPEMKTLFWQMFEDVKGSELEKLKKENEKLNKEIENWMLLFEDIAEELEKYKKMVGELTEKNEDLELHLSNYKFIAQCSSTYADKQAKKIEEMRCTMYDGAEYLEEIAHIFKRMNEDDDPDWME